MFSRAKNLYAGKPKNPHSLDNLKWETERSMEGRGVIMATGHTERPHKIPIHTNKVFVRRTEPESSCQRAKQGLVDRNTAFNIGNTDLGRSEWQHRIRVCRIFILHRDIFLFLNRDMSLFVSYATIGSMDVGINGGNTFFFWRWNDSRSLIKDDTRVCRSPSFSSTFFSFDTKVFSLKNKWSHSSCTTWNRNTAATYAYNCYRHWISYLRTYAMKHHFVRICHQNSHRMEKPSTIELCLWILDFLLSNNHINNIIVHKFDFNDEEIMAYYISFLKTLSLKLNGQTIHFFFNEVSCMIMIGPYFCFFFHILGLERHHRS